MVTPRVVLVGAPGAGKTTVGRLVAAGLGLEFHDTDLAVEAAAGKSVSDIFVDEGEPAFRAFEEAAVAAALGEQGGVVSLGGGAVLAETTRRLLAATATPVVWLQVGLPDAARRVGLARDRPVLALNPRAQLHALLEERSPLYAAVSTLVVNTDERTPEQVAAEVLELIAGSRPPAPGRRVVRVEPPIAGAYEGYDVVIGSDWVADVVAAVGGSSRVAVLHLPSTASLAAELTLALSASVLPIELPDGEAAKDLTIAARCWDALGAAGFTRDDSLVAIGGGAATDLGGFVAATWLRGIAVVHVATTTAGMVDAAIGGKTAVNVAAGKNLVGAFHQPRLVCCPLPVLQTQPPEHHRAGLAEVVKAGLIADPDILLIIEKDPTACLDVRSPAVAELIERSVRVKAEVVGADPKEAGRREILNYGHTLGHAIERVSGYQWRHGDAVAVGLCFAAALGAAAGVTPPELVARQREILASLDLPRTFAGDREELLAAMRVDKKARGSTLRFVVLEDIARPVILADPSAGQLDAAFTAVGS